MFFNDLVLRVKKSSAIVSKQSEGVFCTFTPSLSIFYSSRPDSLHAIPPSPAFILLPLPTDFIVHCRGHKVSYPIGDQRADLFMSQLRSRCKLIHLILRTLPFNYHEIPVHRRHYRGFGNTQKEASGQKVYTIFIIY